MCCWQNICRGKEATHIHLFPDICLLVKEFLLTNCSWVYIFMKMLPMWKELIEKLFIRRENENLYRLKICDFVCYQYSRWIIHLLQWKKKFCHFLCWTNFKLTEKWQEWYRGLLAFYPFLAFYYICFIICSLSIYTYYFQ